MVLVEPSWITPGTPLNVLEFRGVDTSRDGFENILLGLPYFDEDDPQIGEVHVLSTSHFGDDIIVFSEQPNDMFGFQVVGVPIYASWEDGGHNVLISAPNWNDGTGAVGRVYLVEGDTGEILRVFQGTEVDSFFGWSIAPIGDITGNDVPDIAVGAPAAGPNNEGRVYLFDGETGALLDQLDGTSPDGLFGATIASAGRLNGDSVPEILIGAPGNHDGKEEIGRVYVYDGATRALIHEIRGRVEHGRFGASIDGGADVNGDGSPNIVIGAPGVPNWKSGIEPDPIPAMDPDSNPDTGDTPPSPPKQLHSVGRVYVFSTATILNHPAGQPLQTTSADLTLLPLVEGDVDYGIRVEIGNDVTQDGLRNVIVASALETSTSFESVDFDLPADASMPSSRVHVYSGVDGSVVQHYKADDDIEDEVEYVNTGGCPPCPPHCPLCPPVMMTCEQVYTNCPQACHCIRNVTQAFTIRQRNIRRARWGLIGLQVAACVATIKSGPGGCAAATVAIGVAYAGLHTWSRNKFSDDWISCFTNATPSCTAPPFPHW